MPVGLDTRLSLKTLGTSCEIVGTGVGQFNSCPAAAGARRDGDCASDDVSAEHLIGLYSAGMRLPFAGGDDDFDAPSAMTHEEWQELFQRLGRKLGDVDSYSVMFDPYQSGSTPVTGSLADDAADVYCDLKGGLAAIAVGGGLDNAVWEWRFGFDHHWGKHAAEALYALHSLTHPGSVKSVDRDE